MSAPREVIEGGEQTGPHMGTTVTFKIEDTAKGGRLEIKVEHHFDESIGSGSVIDNVEFMEDVYAQTYAKLAPHRDERPQI